MAYSWFGSWGWVVSLMLSCFFFMSFGLVRRCLWTRLILVIFDLGVQFSVSAVPFGPCIDIWRSCRFIGAMMISLCLLPGGLSRFVPCSIGANHCGLRHNGWEKCGHGLTSRPRESASEPFLNELLLFFKLSPWVCSCITCWYSSSSVLCCSFCQ